MIAWIKSLWNGVTDSAELRKSRLSNELFSAYREANRKGILLNQELEHRARCGSEEARILSQPMA